MKLALIKWRDSTLGGINVFTREEIESQTLILLESGGIVLHEDEETITLCTDYFPGNDSARGVNVYPKVLISQIQYFKVKG